MPWVAKIGVFGLFFGVFHEGSKMVFLGLFLGHFRFSLFLVFLVIFVVLSLISCIGQILFDSVQPACLLIHPLLYIHSILYPLPPHWGVINLILNTGFVQ